MSALDDRVNETLNRTLETLRQQLDTALAACREEVSRLASEEGARAAAHAETATLGAKRDAERQLTEWRETAAREAEERERDGDARVRQAEAREHDAAAREREANDQRQEVEARLQASERITEELRRSLDEARLKGEQDVEAARQEAEQIRRQLDQWLQDVEGFKQEVRGFQEALAEATAQAARLPEAIRLLDQAGSLGEALDALVQCAAREAERSAVFLVKGDRLLDWRLVGFDEVSRQRIEIPTDGPGLFGDAVRGARGVSRGEDLPGFAHGSSARHAVAMPLSVGGAVVAVLYADAQEADNQSEPSWPERLDMLARYAGRMLELITIRQAAGLAGVRPMKSAAVSASGHPPAGSVL